MTELVITPGLLLTLMVSAIAAVAVYLDTKRRSCETPPRGDLYMAITAAAAVAAVILALGLASVPLGSAQTPAADPAPSCSAPLSSC
ncbi:hypothetical protein OG523_01590 [Streptomyces virginiae]|uniref:hypothetical protein n=1 Tax=Streptomyces virginiae TaxID=1961 RepID=UPI002E2FA654|nr:hypothetical protein [Streptomyces virginiae]